MKTKGSLTHIGIRLKDLMKIYHEDDFIMVSKKELNAALVKLGQDENSKFFTLNLVNKSSDKIAEPVNEPVKEDAPAPISINSFDGDW